MGATIVKVLLIIWAFSKIFNKKSTEGNTTAVKTETVLESVGTALFGISVIFMGWFIYRCHLANSARGPACDWCDDKLDKLSYKTMKGRWDAWRKKE